MMYDPFNWYWIVAGDNSRAWSSAAGAYVGDWPDDRVTRVDSEDSLTDVLRPYGLPGPVVGADSVVAERTRRLALGFDYDFGDDRGVHRIGMTLADMVGWEEVAKASSAMIALGSPDHEIAIVTDTGPAVVTAVEFQGILVAAASARQPIWAASFVLQALTPIPADYRDDSYWEAQI